MRNDNRATIMHLHKYKSIAFGGMAENLALILRCLHTYHPFSALAPSQMYTNFRYTHQTSGFSLINLLIRSWHSLFSSTTTWIPFCLRYASPPTKVLFSPMTTRATLYMTQAPVHISHGDKEVYMVAPLYADPGSRPVFSRVDISAYDIRKPIRART